MAEPTKKEKALVIGFIITVVLLISVMVLGGGAFVIYKVMTTPKSERPLQTLTEQVVSEAVNTEFQGDGGVIANLPIDKIHQDFMTHFAKPRTSPDKLEKQYRQEWKDYIYSIKLTLYNMQFTKLNELAKQMREAPEQARLGAGFWKLMLFYEALNQEADRFETYKPNSFMEGVSVWVKQDPQEITPYLAKASYLYHQAWEKRGSSFMKELNVVQKAAFIQAINQSRQSLKELEVKVPGIQAPDYFLLKLQLARSKPKPGEDYNALAREALMAAPNYGPLYAEIGTNYLPKWHGRAGEFEEFLNWVYTVKKSQTNRNFESRLYATMVMNQLSLTGDPHQFFSQYTLIWPIIQEGAVNQDKLFPLDKRYLNDLCWLAVAAGDKESAKVLFNAIGSHIELYNWKTQAQFEQYKAWASSPD